MAAVETVTVRFSPPGWPLEVTAWWVAVGAVVLIAGNVPFETQVAPVYIFGQVQSDAPVAAAAVFYLLDVVIRTLLPTRHM